MCNTANVSADNNAGSVVGLNFGQIINTINQTSTDDRLQTCLDALFVTHAPTDRAGRGDPVQGTCDWIEQCPPYCYWRDSGTGSLWIKGGPGMGKTMLAVHLTKRLEAPLRDQDATYAYFFCDHNDSHRNSACAILRTLLAQIIMQRPELMDVASQCVGGNELANERAQRTLASRDALWLILEEAIKRPEFRRLVCLIDGLDECDTDSQMWLARKICSLSKNHTLSSGEPPQFLLLSRRIPVLECLPSMDLDNANVPAYRSGISKFIQSRLQGLRTMIEGFEGGHELEVQSNLEDRCEGSFLWVGCVIEELEKQETCSDLLECLERLPKGLDNLYRRILGQIRKDQREVCAQILKWVAQAARPFTILELSAAIAICGTKHQSPAELTRDKILHCRSLVRLKTHEDSSDISANTVTLVHYSLKQYLIGTIDTASNNDLVGFFFDDKEGHRCLAKRCIDYMQPVPLPQTYWSCNDSHIMASFPLIEYAIRFWSSHARLADEQVLQLVDEHKDFFREGGLACTVWWWSYRSLSHAQTAEDLSKNLLDNKLRKEQTIPPFHLAAASGLLPWLRRFLDDSPRIEDVVNRRDKWDHLPLHHATVRGQVGAIELLLNNGAQIDDLAVFTAASDGLIGILELLLKHGGNCNARARDPYIAGLGGVQETALWESAFCGHQEVMSILLSFGADVNLVAPPKLGLPFPEDSIPFVAACFSGNMLMFQELFSRTKPVPKDIRYGFRVAVKAGQACIVEALLPRLASSRPNEEYVREVLYDVIIAGLDVSMLERITQQFDVDLVSPSNTTSSALAFDYLVRHANAGRISAGVSAMEASLLEYEHMLRTSDFEIDPISVRFPSYSSSYLDAALYNSRYDIAQYLIGKGAELAIPKDSATKATHDAAQKDSAQALRILFSSGFSIGAPRRSGNTLHTAAKHNSTAAAATILAASTSALINVANDKGHTPLFIAADHGQLDMVKLLLKAGALLHPKDKQKKTALMRAKEKGHMEIVDAIKEHQNIGGKK